MIAEFILTLGIVLIPYAIYKYKTVNKQYFAERNVECKDLSFSLYNIYAMFVGKNDVIQFVQRHYDQFPDEPLYGIYGIMGRQVFIRDPDLCKQIFVKDFVNFEDRKGFINEDVDELWGKSLLSLHGEKWRQMRATLSPAFTGSKMRLMFELVLECADGIIKHFLKQIENGEKINLEMKDFFSRYTNDVIASCAFGIKVNSIAEPDNSFYRNGKVLMDFSGVKRSIKFFVTMLCTKFARLFNIKFFDEAISNEFKAMILNTMDLRKKNHIFRPDMINILMQVRDGVLNAEEAPKEVSEGFATVEESEVGKTSVSHKWNDDELVAQCLVFFLAGFETSSSVLSFAAYEILANPDVQQKLYEEIAEVNEQLGEKRVSYDVLQKMKYLDQVVSETLRKWPVAVMIDRLCVKNYVYDDGKQLNFKIDKGVSVLFSLMSIQNDPKYFPNPSKFDPERFSDENKHNIVPGTYNPFGLGPRNCIGSRFALMELKAILYYLLLNFSLEPNKDTQIPLKLRKSPFVIAEKGVHLELKPRAK
ncbi:probable cytochrome P450 9f2 [Sitodiplosis mosellana]|uniref:probable cytochrome P450 9f2 n=1 Tax=Sitodiplosis mosellana TaxID=263140 RepID=UPI002444410A|nr:probable cytochrome P450 9f2 [Sitodiplosis mosellana]